MTMVPFKGGSYAVGERLTSAQVNTVNNALPGVVDGAGGGSYTPSAPIQILGSSNLQASTPVNNPDVATKQYVDIADIAMANVLGQVFRVALTPGALASSQVVLGATTYSPAGTPDYTKSGNTIIMPYVGIYWVSYDFAITSSNATGDISMSSRLMRGSDAMLNCFSRRYSTDTAHEVHQHVGGLVEITNIGTQALSIEAYAASDSGTVSVYSAQNPQLSIMRLPTYQSV